MEAYGKLTSVRDGNLDLESSMESLASQQYNGYALQVEKMIIPLKDAVNSFNHCINAYVLEGGQCSSSILTENIKWK
jgi:hypothetical protein